MLASIPPSQRSQPTRGVSFLFDPSSQLKLASKMVAELAYHLGECNSAEDSDSLKDGFSFTNLPTADSVMKGPVNTAVPPVLGHRSW